MVKKKVKIESNYQQHSEVTKNLEIVCLVNLYRRVGSAPNYSAFARQSTYVEVAQWPLVAAAERVEVEEVEDVGAAVDYQYTYSGGISLLLDYWNKYVAEKEWADFE